MVVAFALASAEHADRRSDNEAGMGQRPIVRPMNEGGATEPPPNLAGCRSVASISAQAP